MKNRKPIVVLTSSLLTDRMLVYTDFLAQLSRERDVVVWSTSARNVENESIWSTAPAKVEPFPRVREYREAYNYLRRVNEAAWDVALDMTSRKSFYRLARSTHRHPVVKAMDQLGFALGHLRAHAQVERLALGILSRPARSDESTERLRAIDPSAVLVTNPFWLTEPGIATTATRMNIPVFAFVPSWDNLSTKARLVFRPSGWIVWSETAQDEIARYYPRSNPDRVHVVGAPQYDVFFDRRFSSSRRQFCERMALDDRLPIVTYALGSPNMFDEHYAAQDLADRIVRGELGDIQLVVRPHPLHDRNQLAATFSSYGPRVVFQGVSSPDRDLLERSQSVDEVRTWVATFQHSDVVVNLASTATLDAAIFDKPVVNLDFDPAPSALKRALVHDVNHRWSHFAPVAESGGVWLTKSLHETATAVSTYIRTPDLHRQARREIVELVCGQVDGKAGARMADALCSLVDDGR